jgi:hypothetical protein
MNRLFRLPLLPWLGLVAGAALLVIASSSRRIGDIERISQLAPATATNDASPTGYERGNRNLILPERTPSGQPWIMDVQRMAAPGTGPANRVDYDNAPEGRPIHGAAPYRAWLRWVSGLEERLGGYSAGRSVERAALHANVLLHVLLCVGAGLFAAGRFGPAAGGFLALGVALVFPLTTLFAPGQPDDHALFISTHLAGLLCLLAGIQASEGRAARICFAVAGTAAGFGLWLDAGSQLTVLGATALGGSLAVWFADGARDRPLPWRWWAGSGAIIAFIGWLVEARPGGVGGAGLDANHPLLLLPWLAGAETLVRLHGARRGVAQRREVIVLASALAVMVFAPAWMLYHGGIPKHFGPDGSTLAAYTAAHGWIGWIREGGLSLPLIAAGLPLLLLAAALWQWRRRPDSRPTLVLAIGMTGALLIIAFVQLRWWTIFDVALLGLLVVVTTGIPAGLARIAWHAGFVLLLVPGFIVTWPKTPKGEELSPAQARTLIERDLAQWLSARSEPGTIVFAPPALSASLCYYGGLPVIASPYPGNQDGLTLAVRIAATTSTDEAQALLIRRGIRYIVIPSWDTVLDEFAKVGSGAPERSLISLLRQWLPPRWLRPVPYQMPTISGLAGDSVAIFEVVEPQENAAALSRLAEYFMETGRLDLAVAVSDSLEQAFANDAGAMIARAQVALARGESRTLARLIPVLLPAVADGKDEDLSWERRANLAIVLAQVKRPDLARAQVAFCLEEADAERLRSLGTVSLYRLLTLARGFNLSFAEPGLRDTALALLPEEFRNQLPK